MAGSGNITLTKGLRQGLGNGAGVVGEFIPDTVQKGYGTPTHIPANGTIYIKLDATMGTTSHYRFVAGSGWAPMSDD